MIPPALRDFPQWVCAKNGSKSPWKAFANGMASVGDPTTWARYDNAVSAVNQGLYDNLGFVFNNNGIVGIDIDAGYDEEGFITPEAAKVISLCKSYTERSRSGRGFHILLRGTLPFSGKNNLAGMEIYQAKRYFILTGDVLIFDDLIENQEAIDFIVEKYFPYKEKESGKRVIERIYSPEWPKPVDNRFPLRPVYPRIPRGCRNICLTSLAGLMHNVGYSPEAIFEELRYANQVACDPALDENELETITSSVTRYKR